MRLFADRFGNPLYLLSALLIVLFLFGGSARADSLGQAVAVPVALLMLLVGTFRFAGTFSAFRSQGLFLAAACALILVQLIPLPPSIWFALPGHDQFKELARLTETEDLWRPLNLVPQLGWVALGGLLPPAAVFALAAGVTASINRSSDRELSRHTTAGQSQSNAFDALVIVIVLLGLVSLVMSVVQLLGPADGALYFHRVTNEGSAVGLFANRNHNAAFLVCVIPLLAVWASMPNRNARNLIARRSLLMAAAGLIVMLVLIGGSRAGVVMAMIGLGWSFVIYRKVGAREIRGEQERLKRLNLAFVVAIAIGMVLLTIILSRAQSVVRVIEGDDTNVVVRTDFWQVTWRQALEFFPFGTGLGSFVESYRMVEPLEFMSSYYVNHAHNDWLEAFHGGGAAAAALLVAISLWWLKRTVTLFRTSASERSAGRLALAGSAIASILGVASVVDYPLRTAPLAALFMLALLWLSGDAGGRGLTSR